MGNVGHGAPVVEFPRAGQPAPGTLGLRAQHARIEAIWVSGRIPSGSVALLRKRYPSAVLYSSKRAMLRRHRLSRLDSYRRVPFHETRLASLRFPFWRPDGPGPPGRAASSPRSSCCCAGGSWSS